MRKPFVKRLLPRSLLGRSLLIIVTPLVLAYQAWSYWVFRKRIAVHHIPTAQAVVSAQS